MNCPICEYRRIARQALSLLSGVLAAWQTNQPDRHGNYVLGHQRLKMDFREVYRAEQQAKEEADGNGEVVSDSVASRQTADAVHA